MLITGVEGGSVKEIINKLLALLRTTFFYASRRHATLTVLKPTSKSSPTLKLIVLNQILTTNHPVWRGVDLKNVDRA